MTKKFYLLFIFVLMTAFNGFGPYKDGRYRATSRAQYTYEPYYGSSEIIIENGRITKVVFFIRDSLKHEMVNENYEKYFAGNDLYIEQCRNDTRGIRSYPDSLIKYQELDKVDAISGATWSYNIFMASARQALSQAEEEK